MRSSVPVKLDPPVDPPTPRKLNLRTQSFHQRMMQPTEVFTTSARSSSTHKFVALARTRSFSGTTLQITHESIAGTHTTMHQTFVNTRMRLNTGEKGGTYLQTVNPRLARPFLRETTTGLFMSPPSFPHGWHTMAAQPRSVPGVTAACSSAPPAEWMTVMCSDICTPVKDLGRLRPAVLLAARRRMCVSPWFETSARGSKPMHLGVDREHVIKTIIETAWHFSACFI